MEPPKLIEPGVSYFFNNILRSCHETKQKYNNVMVNIVLFFLLIFFLFIVLNYRKNNKTYIKNLKRKKPSLQRFFICWFNDS